MAGLDPWGWDAHLEAAVTQQWGLQSPGGIFTHVWWLGWSWIWAVSPNTYTISVCDPSVVFIPSDELGVGIQEAKRKCIQRFYDGALKVTEHRAAPRYTAQSSHTVCQGPRQGQ